MVEKTVDVRDDADWLPEGGKMASLTRSFDWSGTPLGKRSQWSHSLCAAVSMIMEADCPMALLWGPSLTLLFNDAYDKITCGDMAAAFGQSNHEGSERSAVTTCTTEDSCEFALRRSPVRLKSGAIGGTLITARKSDGHGTQHSLLKATAKRNAYLVRLNDAIRQNGGPTRIQTHAIDLLTEQLDADRTLYAEVSSDQDTVYVRADSCKQKSASVVGRYSFAAFGSYVADAMKEGRTLAVSDIARLDQLEERERTAYRALDIAAYVAVPLLKEGKVLAFVAVNQTTPRAWNSDDVILVEETTTRICAAVEQARAETALLRSENRYRSLFEAMWEGFAVMELVYDTKNEAIDFRYVMFNPALERLTRLHRDDVVGRMASEIFPGEYKQSLAVYKKVVESKEVHRFEAEYASLGRIFNITAFPYNGHYFAILYDDITECRRAEKKLNDANQQLRIADQRKNAFLGLLSHELRNPLTPICTSSYILGQVPPQSEQAERAKVVISRQVTHMRRLIDELLDVTRISSGKIHLVCKPTNLVAIVGDAVEDHRQEFAKRGVELRLDVTSPAVWVSADSTRIAQVLGNLLQNAVKFTPRGGETAVCLRSDPSGRQATITVCDSGYGIEPKILANIFDPFIQADESLHRTGGGLGLGLSVAKGLVELHGGNIAATSDGLQRGAKFKVTLPTIDHTPCEAACLSAKTHTVTRRILIVEDNQDAADAIREILLLGGHEVRVACDGPQALAEARSFRPNTVLCDLGLPVMNGFEVARQLSAERWPERPHLIALSGYAQADDLLRSKDAGFDEHLAKPPSIASLNRLIAKGR